ncbi:hypothetical protein CIG75_14190 [Tumebacillus algifaecis]|uniref:AAA domain-containing protein n=1 Tax=Tumebacillus algifaecis TaxID=1214604 RepID=A0A223D2V9_9BACL|nr:AAA family ATPase [Tumebacillus algifaecis]ASS75999.1 hypothetical protein CIG75_14190 [Tumebacillus algifaecis]
MAIVTSLINWKGGVGKTTLSYHLATGLAYKRKRVLLIDLDPQCNLSYLAIGAESYMQKVYEDHQRTLNDVFDGYFRNIPVLAHEIIQKKMVRSSPGNVYNHVDIILSHQDLRFLDHKLAQFQKHGLEYGEYAQHEIQKLSVLKNLLDQVEHEYDYIFLDCPPSVSYLTQNAFYTSHFYLVPALPDHLSTIGVSLIRNYMEKFDQQFAGLCAHVHTIDPYTVTKFGGTIFNRVREYRGTPRPYHRKFINSLRNKGVNVFDSYLVEGDGITLSSEHTVPIYAYEYLPKEKTNAEKQVICLTNLVTEFQIRIKEVLQDANI